VPQARTSGMAREVVATGDASSVLDRAGAFLEGDPVRHNVILTLLQARAASREPGRYWIASDDGHVCGVVFQSPLSFVATITPMDASTVDAVVVAIATAGVLLPGVSGDAATAARFAGAWTERHTTGARPEQGQRIYEIVTVEPVVGVSGRLRQAVEADRLRLLAWLRGFYDDTGEGGGDPERAVAHRVAAGQLWLWDHDGPVSMAAVTAPAAGVARIQTVYTPPELRKRGYASACVAQLSADTVTAGSRCVLYTDLGNPTSNSIYRRIGYEAVAEVLRYRFDGRSQAAAASP